VTQGSPQQQRSQNPRLTPIRLHAAIVETLWAEVSAGSLEHVCDLLGMPAGPPHVRPMSSKRIYVRERLKGVGFAAMIGITQTIVAEYDDTPLLDELLGPPGVRGVDGELKNLIFAAHGPKPRIVLKDAINNIIDIVEHADKCLVYDRPLEGAGLLWGELVSWWSGTSLDAGDEPDRSLYRRLLISLDSEPEKLLFKSYGARYGQPDADKLPALIPQVYLHYDPYTMRELGGRSGQVLARQRMDFLLLLPDRSRVVIEIDGKQHYADGNTASPRLYAEMAREDRRLRLTGYEVYRWGGAELMPDDTSAPRRVEAFFDELLERHQA
jgi:very-short-patch-repair endonuclease